MLIDAVDFTKKLIRCPSITPVDAGALDVLETALMNMGFSCTRLPFSHNGTDDVDNLFARLGSGPPHFCYAGHTDVVPTGDVDEWKFDPFAAVEKDGIIYGRGTSDMKGGIASFISAVSEFLAENKEFEGSISFLITGDEEGPAINGTIKMLDWLKTNDQVPDICLVGEPTNLTEIGDMAKIGRRGSMNTTLTVHGAQGHVAYPHLADNPIPRLIEMLHKFTNVQLDRGNDFFQSSNLEVVTVDVGNVASNIIPLNAVAKFNIRFNNEQSIEGLQKWIKSICDEVGGDYSLDINVSGDAFLTPEGTLSALISDVVKDVTGHDVELSTSGGTSDARFIKNYCPVAEFGLINKTIHKVDECVHVKDLLILRDVYKQMLKKYFNDDQ